MRHLHAAFLAAGLLMGSALPALSHGYEIGDIAIGHPWSRATPATANVAAGYLTLDNKGAGADRLLGGSSPLAERVEVHSMDVIDDVMTMRHLADGLDVPAGETTRLEPGGYHLMLFGIERPFAQGDMVPVTLRFEHAGSVDVELAVEAMAAGAAQGAHDGH